MAGTAFAGTSTDRAGVTADKSYDGTDKVPALITDSSAHIIADNQNIKTAGQDGPGLIEDAHFFEKLAHFDRERIPERVVHARGTGAQGVFISDVDFSEYSQASLFQKGKKTPIVMRFSTVLNRPGSPEWIRDPRGFAVKFKTDTGNWDVVGIDFPVFFIRDAIKFPDLIHSNRPDPVTEVQDLVGRFDFFANSPENTHALTWLYSQRYGVPKDYRHLDGYGVHAFRTINKDGKQFFVKFHFKSQQGVEGLTAEQISHTDWNYATKDLYGNIQKGNFPQWDLYAQVLTPEQAKALPYDAFDDTKDWIGVKEIRLGSMVLNKIPDNFFQWTEEAAYSPSNMIPGIYASPDKMLQGRIFSYPDTQRYRLGVNYQDLPVNAPLVAVHNDQQDGTMSAKPQKGHANYQPTSFWEDQWATVDQTNPGNGHISAAAPKDSPYASAVYTVSGKAEQRTIAPMDDFAQAGILYRSFSEQEKQALISNLVADMKGTPYRQNPRITLIRDCAYFYKADTDYGTRLADAMGLPIKDVKAVAKSLSANLG
ncbi:catalase [Acetobacteraceae bacterium]|nr:catalase [Acetobacteraceae bacterium]